MNDRNSKGNFVSKTETNEKSCYGCGLLAHMIKDCPNIKKENKRTGFKSKKVGKRDIIVT